MCSQAFFRTNEKKILAIWRVTTVHILTNAFFFFLALAINFSPCIRVFDISHWCAAMCSSTNTCPINTGVKVTKTVNAHFFFSHNFHNMHSGMLQWQLQQLTSCLDVNCPMPQGTAIMSMLIRLYAYREQLNDLTSL